MLTMSPSVEAPPILDPLDMLADRSTEDLVGFYKEAILGLHGLISFLTQRSDTEVPLEELQTLVRHEEHRYLRLAVSELNDAHLLKTDISSKSRKYCLQRPEVTIRPV